MNIDYVVPKEILAPEELLRQAKRRRDALTAAGCSTYALGVRSGVSSIVCLCCGLGSVNPGDVGNHYCGFCNAFHAEERQDA